ncbi:tubulin epsilon and delta complex protein 1 [Aplochiton taeniatus]
MAEMKQRKQQHNVSIKEVIGYLCRLLTTLGLESVPNPESFRRAKFNKGGEVVEDFWKLLNDISIIISTNHQKKTDVGSGYTLVGETLWLSGWGADLEDAHMERKEVTREKGSRQLLLALGWLISSDLLEQLLRQKAAELDTTLTLSPILTLSPTQVQSKGEGLHLDSALLRKLQWLIGCLKFQGRTLLTMQEERVRLLHQECELMQRLCELLEAYLHWKHMEKLFWVWMDSVLDCQLAAQGKEVPVAIVPTQTTSHRKARYLHGDPAGLQPLDIMLMRLPLTQSQVQGPNKTPTDKLPDFRSLCAAKRGPVLKCLQSSQGEGVVADP